MSLVVNQVKYWWIKTQFYNRSMKFWLQGNDIEIYLAHNEGKSVVAKKLLEL